ncbi:MAG: hypothetical protein ACI9WT_001343, partial [Flavobacterium sp.]
RTKRRQKTEWLIARCYKSIIIAISNKEEHNEIRHISLWGSSG